MKGNHIKGTKWKCENNVSPIENTNKETKIIYKDQIEILDLKSTITQMKNSLEHSSRFEQAEESTFGR